MHEFKWRNPSPYLYDLEGESAHVFSYLTGDGTRYRAVPPGSAEHRSFATLQEAKDYVETVILLGLGRST